ncbi:MAG: hypothetical protein NXI22_08085 [bacterium]|nr:hypothetical protein [bacterium]
MKTGSPNSKVHVQGRRIFGLLLFGLFGCCIALESAQAQRALHSIGSALRQFKRHTWDNKEPRALPDRCTEYVASEIDWLEHQVELYGSVAPKHPNVWGEARLTNHRHQYELQLKEMFDRDLAINSLQGAQRRSDQSFLALALATESTIAGAEVEPPAVTNVFNSVGIDGSKPFKTSDASSQINVTNTTPETGAISIEPTKMADQVSRYLKHLNQLRRLNEGDDNADSPGYALNLVRIPVSILPGKHTRVGYGAEISFTATPFISDQLLPDTFEDMVINDLVDQLALPITKMIDCEENRAAIMSTHTQIAVVTNSIDIIGNLDPENNEDDKKELERLIVLNIRVADTYLSDNSVVFKRLSDSGKRAISTKLKSEIAASRMMLEGQLDKIPRDTVERYVSKVIGREVAIQGTEKIRSDWSALMQSNFAQDLQSLKEFSKGIELDGRAASQVAIENYKDSVKTAQTGAESAITALQDLNEQITSVLVNHLAGLPNTLRNRRSSLPYPNSQLLDVFGSSHMLTQLALDALPSLNDDDVIQLMDVRRYLYDEIHSAHRSLMADRGEMLSRHCTPELALAVFARQKQYKNSSCGVVETLNGKQCFDSGVALKAGRFGRDTFEQNVARFRDNFLYEIESVRDPVTCNRNAGNTTTAILSWGIIVESALLNQHLMTDMIESARAKGTEPPVFQGQWLDCYLPTPSFEANEAFKQYVNCRWPIRVFHVDPIAQEQNIADAYSHRREMQFAIAAAVATGKIRSNRALQFARNLEKDVETIQLNGTVVGFSHASDTFGWRFYPRFQTPDSPGTIGAFAQNAFGFSNGKDADLMHRRLEPGVRECTALVVMPSFVPYVTIESRSNWFCLVNPANRELTMKQTLELSRKFQKVRKQTGSLCENGKYRPGDVSHMHSVLNRLEHRLPLQSMQVSIPHENTAGGFELFSNGVTDLAPELLGWYGAAGIETSSTATCDSEGVDYSSGSQCAGTCGGTTLFLVGDGFSVNDTKVIAGGKCVPYMLLSRQIMRVTVPASAIAEKKTVCGKEQEVIDVHIATPYGVTNHVYVPAIKSAKDAAADKVEERLKKLEALAENLSAAGIPPTIAITPAEPMLVDAFIENPIRFKTNDTKFTFTLTASSTGLPDDISGGVFLSTQLRFKGGELIGKPIPVEDESLKAVQFSGGKIEITAEELLDTFKKISVFNSPLASQFSDTEATELEAVFFVSEANHQEIRVIGTLPVHVTKYGCCRADGSTGPLPPPTGNGKGGASLNRTFERIGRGFEELQPPRNARPVGRNDFQTFDTSRNSLSRLPELRFTP